MPTTERRKQRVVEYHAKLQIWMRYDGRDWVVWCPAIDVMTQARTKKDAFRAVREAVEGWFESCIERDTLDKALVEVGFIKNVPGSDFAAAFDQVQVKTKEVVEQMPERSGPVVQAHLPRRRRGTPDYVEVSIPAFIAARYLEGASAAR